MKPVNVGDIGGYRKLLLETHRKCLKEQDKSEEQQNNHEKELVTEGNSGYESPKLADVDENYERYQNAKRIRDNSRQNYTKNMKLM